MKGFTFKISAESQKKVFREVLIPENMNFEDFHFAILDAFEIDAGEMASFYVSDSQWQKNKEITLMDMGATEEGKNTALMQDTLVCNHASKVKDRLLYVYDFLFCKDFKLELIAVEAHSDGIPMLLKSEGQYASSNSQVNDLENLILEGFEQNEEFQPKKEKKVTSPHELSKKEVKETDDFEEFNHYFNEDIEDPDNPQFENIDDLDL